MSAEDAPQPAPPTPTEEMYRLRLTGEGTAIERDVPRSVALGIIQLALGGHVAPVAASAIGSSHSIGSAAAAPTGAESPMGHAPRNGQPSISVGEFIDDVEAKRNPDKITAIAVWLTDVAGRESFGSDDIREQFQRAGEPMPANFSRDFKWAVTNKWLSATVGDSDAYYVTGRGRKAVESHFADEVIRRTRQPSGKRGAKRADDDANGHE